MTFEMVPDEHSSIKKAFTQLKEILGAKDVESSLYRDLNHANRFMIAFYTESDLEEITNLIQQDEQTKHCFEQMKSAESRIIVNALEQVA